MILGSIPSITVVFLVLDGSVNDRTASARPSRSRPIPPTRNSMTSDRSAGTSSDAARPDLLDQDASFRRPDLVVESLQEVETNEPVDLMAIRKVEDMDREIGKRKSERRELRQAQDVPCS